MVQKVRPVPWAKNRSMVPKELSVPLTHNSNRNLPFQDALHCQWDWTQMSSVTTVLVVFNKFPSGIGITERTHLTEIHIRICNITQSNRETFFVLNNDHRPIKGTVKCCKIDDQNNFFYFDKHTRKLKVLSNVLHLSFSHQTMGDKQSLIKN